MSRELELLEALGLENHRVISIDLHWERVEIPSATVRILIVDREQEKLVEVLKKYRLETRE